jgi:cysteinyl-tRNA synthetase
MKKKSNFLSILGALLATSLLIVSCGEEENSPSINEVNFRQEMRNFVMELSSYSKGIKPGFLIIPQNGQELITDNGELDGVVQKEYLKTIDATGSEDLFYGYDQDDHETPIEDSNYLIALFGIFEENKVKVLAIDYCSTIQKMDKSYQLNHENGFISFAADQRNLNDIPSYPSKPFDENSADILAIFQAKNFLYLINSEKFETKEEFITAVSATNYDLIIMDLYHNEEMYSLKEVEQLKQKENGGKRLLICYMSIGEAENYRYYWESGWNPGTPTWLGRENPDWEGNYKVHYWNQKWKDIITGNPESYIDKVLTSGFDGVYLDVIDAFEYYEE